MLNYVWISLIAIGILVAVGSDTKDEIENPYRNGVPVEARIEVQGRPSTEMASWEGDLVLSGEYYRAFYSAQGGGEEIRKGVKVTTASTGSSVLMMNMDDRTPERWKLMASSGGTKDRLKGFLKTVRFTEEGSIAEVTFEFEPVHFVKLRAITHAALDYAGTAVTIALGLIGIMALWLGVMKVAEEAGLIRSLTKLLTPLTKRLFPEIPPDHPTKRKRFARDHRRRIRLRRLFVLIPHPRHDLRRRIDIRRRTIQIRPQDIFECPDICT